MKSLLFNTLSRFVIAFLPRSSCLLISWLQSQSAVILKPKKRKFFCHYFSLFPFYLPWSNGARCCDLRFFKYLVLSCFFHSPSSVSSRSFLVPLHFLPLEWYYSHICGCCGGTVSLNWGCSFPEKIGICFCSEPRVLATWSYSLFEVFGLIWGSEASLLCLAVGPRLGLSSNDIAFNIPISSFYLVLHSAGYLGFNSWEFFCFILCFGYDGRAAWIFCFFIF